MRSLLLVMMMMMMMMRGSLLLLTLTLLPLLLMQLCRLLLVFLYSIRRKLAEQQRAAWDVALLNSFAALEASLHGMTAHDVRLAFFGLTEMYTFFLGTRFFLLCHMTDSIVAGVSCMCVLYSMGSGTLEEQCKACLNNNARTT